MAMTKRKTAVDMKLEIVVLGVSRSTAPKRYTRIRLAARRRNRCKVTTERLQITAPGSGLLVHLRQERHRCGTSAQPRVFT